jgi:hypothetical protein
LGLVPKPPVPVKLALEPVLFRSLGSPALLPRASSSIPPSSDLMLRRVVTEFTEVFRPRLRDKVTSRSSDRWPCSVNCGCSDGWERADAKASRTGKGVRLRTWMDEMCRIRRCTDIRERL